MYLETIPESAAPPDVAAMYEQDAAKFGFLPNLTRAFSHRPAVYAAWNELNKAVRANLDDRRYELATVAAARALRSSYCTLAHGELLAGLAGAEVAIAAVRDPQSALLDSADKAVVALAEKVATDAAAVTQEDVDALTGLGLSDAEVFDVIATAAMRAFFSKVLDGTGARPDARFDDLEPAELRDACTVGHPIAAPEG